MQLVSGVHQQLTIIYTNCYVIVRVILCFFDKCHAQQFDCKNYILKLFRIFCSLLLALQIKLFYATTNNGEKQQKKLYVCSVKFYTFTHRPVTRRAQGGEDPLENVRHPLEKCVGHSLKQLDIVKKYGPLSENSSPLCGAIIGCARVCSRVLLDWRFFSVPFLAYLFILLRLRYTKVRACTLLV